MKVLFLTPWYPDDPRLQGIFIRDQAVAIAEQHEVFLISSKIDKSSFGFLSYRAVEGSFRKVKEHRLTVKKSFAIYNQLNFFLVTFWYTWKKTRNFRPDVIHSNIAYPGAFWAWAVSRWLRVPYCVTEHSTRFANHMRSPLHRWLSVPFMKRASAVIAVSENSATDIQSYIKKRPVVIPNMIEVEKFENLPIPDQPHASGSWQIGFLGGLDYDRKGLDVLMKAVAPMRVPFVLHIGGEGRLLGQYQKLARELGLEPRCVYYGFLPEGDVPGFMSRLHIFVSASREEGFGMVIAEAIAAGIPVVATRSGGPDDFVVPENGILIPVDDVEKLRESIEWIMLNYNSYRKDQMKRGIRDRYSPEAITSRIGTVYTAMISGNATDR